MKPCVIAFAFSLVPLRFSSCLDFQHLALFMMKGHGAKVFDVLSMRGKSEQLKVYGGKYVLILVNIFLLYFISVPCYLVFAE